MQGERIVRNKLLISSTLVASLLGATTLTSHAQAPAATGTKIGVVDVGYIFKNHAGINQRLKSVETTLKAYDTELTGKRNSMQAEVAQLKTLKAGSADYAAQEEKLARMDSELKLEASRKRKELAEAEAKVYFESYQLISSAVAQIANFNGVDLVLRYNSEEMDLKDEESVLRGLQKSVVFRRDNMDMTQLVMQFLDKTSGQTQTPSASNGNPPATSNRQIQPQGPRR
jgi:Skp family chaperone for outer membrane proteins